MTASSGAGDPWAVGLAHEAQASADEREQRGAWYTPRPVVEGLLRLALPEGGTLPDLVVDPTCGGGAFLLGALDRLVDLGLEPGEAASRVAGVDIDVGAIDAAASAVGLWCKAHEVDPDAVRLKVGDALAGLPTDWPKPDVIVGNPPFATPLRGRNHPASAAAFREKRPELLGPYADLAAIHLASSYEQLAPGGTICLVLPQSMLAARDLAGLRHLLDTHARPTGVWATREAVFAAGVRVWAPVLKSGGRNRTVRLATGTSPGVTGTTRPAPWAQLVAEALGVPSVELDETRTLGSDERLGPISATAGFRDEYYGLVDACREGSAGDMRPRLTTVGSLDPLRSFWGVSPTTFAKSKWDRPVIDQNQLSPRVGQWVSQQLRPKVVLPTQSKVFEPVIDRTGHLVPATPVLSIHAEPADLAMVAAVLLAPPVVAWSASRWFGGALSVDAIKLAARNVAELPTPLDGDRWRNAAAELVVAEGAGPSTVAEVLRKVGHEMTRAYGAADSVYSWWETRLP